MNNFYTVFTYLMMFLHTFIGLILIAVILLQRGRGGGLAGAFGGMGGQSAFGTKAGDVFTKITIVLATIWIVLGCVCVLLASNYKHYKPTRMGAFAPEVTTAPEDEEKPGAGETKPDEKKAGDKKDDKLKDDVPPGPADPKAEDKPDPKQDPKDAAKPKADGDQPKDDGAPKPDAKNKDAKDKDADPAAAKESSDKKPE
jgi:preprotein translocase subunit SecG